MLTALLVVTAFLAGVLLGPALIVAALWLTLCVLLREPKPPRSRVGRELLLEELRHSAKGRLRGWFR